MDFHLILSLYHLRIVAVQVALILLVIVVVMEGVVEAGRGLIHSGVLLPPHPPRHLSIPLAAEGPLSRLLPLSLFQRWPHQLGGTLSELLRLRLRLHLHLHLHLLQRSTLSARLQAPLLLLLLLLLRPLAASTRLEVRRSPPQGMDSGISVVRRLQPRLLPLLLLRRKQR